MEKRSKTLEQAERAFFFQMRIKVVGKGGRSNGKKEMESNSKLVETKKAAKHGAHCGRAKAWIL